MSAFRIRLLPIVASFLILGSGCQRDSSGDLEARNKETVIEFFDAIDEGDLDRVSTTLAIDFVGNYVGVGEWEGIEATLDKIRSFYSSFPDNRHVIEEIVAEGNKVLVQVMQHATHKGDYEGIAPTGKRVNVPETFTLTLVDGKITEMWLLQDNLGLMEQLGMKLVPIEPGANGAE